MEIRTNYQLAATLVKNIIAPSNQTGISEDPHKRQAFNPDKAHPVYLENLSAPTRADTHNLLNDLYHTKRALNHYKPDDYRIGSVNELQADINQLGRLILYDIDLNRLRALENITEEELDKALAISIDYSGLSDIEFYYLYLYIHKYRFQNEVWSRISGSDGIAEEEPELAERILEESIRVQQRALAYSGSFSQWTRSFMRTLGNEWLFERFLMQVNCTKATGQPQTEPKYCYRKFSPSMPEYVQRKITIHDFPGPGLAVYGLHSKLFPLHYLEKRFSAQAKEMNTMQEIDSEYRNLLVRNVDLLSKTTFAFFRGLVIVYNPDLMRVEGKPCGLLIFNDHFPHEHIKTAYLVRGKYVSKFLKDPYSCIGKSNIFYPNFLEQRRELKEKLIRLVSVASTAGMCEEVPGYDNERMDIKNRRRLHTEVTNSSFIGFTLLDLVREAYRLYLLGYQYNKQRNEFNLDEFVMLRELLRINKQASQKVDEPPKELPIAFPFTFFDHSVEDSMVRGVGFVGANMVVYKNNPKGDCMLFPDSISCINPEDIDFLDVERIKELIGGHEEYSRWADFREACEFYPANPLIVDPVYRKVGADIISSYNS